MQKIKTKFLLMIVFLGLAFVALLNLTRNVKASGMLVTSVDVYVEDGSDILFSSASEMQHYIYVQGSENVSFTMNFDNYCYTAGEWEGCMEIILNGDVSRLQVNIIASGECILTGGNHPGLRVPSNCDVALSIQLQDNSSISFGSQDHSKGISNSNNTWENIDYRLINVENAQNTYNILRNSSDDYLLLRSENNSDNPTVYPENPSGNQPTGDAVLVSFSANGARIYKEVSLPYTFRCDYGSEEGELDLIIKQLYELESGFCEPYDTPSVSGASSSLVECTIEDASLCITIKEAFSGLVVVDGSYIRRVNNDNETFPFTLEITTSQQQSGDDPQNPDDETIEARENDINENYTVIRFNQGDEMVQNINVHGDGSMTFAMVFAYYNYTAPLGSGAAAINFYVDSSVTMVIINVSVYGNCSLIGDSLPGFYLPNNVPFEFHFQLPEEDSILRIGTQNGSRAIRRTDGTYDDITYELILVDDPNGELMNSLIHGSSDIYTLRNSNSQSSEHEHIAGEWETERPATCTESGLEVLKCLECEKIIDEREIEPLEHQFEWHTTLEPTCTRSGEKAEICSICGERGITELIDPLEHVYEWHTIDPTCTEDGERIGVCQECGHEVSEPIEALGHDYIHHEAQKPTYDSEGWDEYDTCSRCDYVSPHQTYPVLVQPTVVNSEKIYINDGDSILFNNTSEMTHYVYISSSTSTADITMTFDNYNFEAGYWAGCLELIIDGNTSISHLNIHIIVNGDNTLIGGNHPGLRVPNIPVLITLEMNDNSSIRLGAQHDDNWGIQNGNNEDGNISLTFVNVNDEEGVRESLRNMQYTIYSTNYGEQQTHEHTYEWVVIEEPTCDEPGYEEYICIECDDVKDHRYTDPLGHNWGEPIYKWNEDYTSLTATRYCKNDESHIETETVGARVVDEVDATCEHAGQRIITSDPFDNPAFVQKEITFEIEQIEHDWSEPTYKWNEDYTSLTATRVCKFDESHIETETVEATLVESINPTCTVDGKSVYVSAEFDNSAFEQQTITVAIEALGHDLIYHEAKSATFDDGGWDEYYTCSRCDFETDHNTYPALERPDIEDPKAQEEFKEQVTQNITNIIGESAEAETIVEDIANTPVEVLVDIIEVVGNAYNAVNDMFADVEEGEKVEVQPGVELTKEEVYEIIQSVTVSTIVIAGSQESQVEAAAELTNSLPEDSGIDMGEIVSGFYERVLSELLSSPNKSNENVNSIMFNNNGNNITTLDSIFSSSLSNNSLVENMLKIVIKFNPFARDGETEDANSQQGIDYSVSAETYQMAIEFVNTSVENMTEAAQRIRQCSGEAMKTTINHYISGVSVQSFRDFDRAKADAEFAEAAYKAILISLQETVMNTLTENFEKAKANKSGRALKDLEEAYQEEMEQVKHLHFLEDKTDEECEGCFEDVVIEVMRLKFLSILNNKKDNKEITDELFAEYASLALDVETFTPIYKDIFFCWATGAENNLEIEITLQELSDAAIENTSTKFNQESANVKMLGVDWIIIGSFVAVAALLAVGYILISRRKGEE